MSCRKSARRCGAKHISKSTCTKKIPEHFWKSMLEKCTQLWHEAHVEVKMYKTHHSWTLFEVRVCFRVAGARDSAPHPNVRVLQQFQKLWQAWEVSQGSAKMHFALQVQYKRHVQRTCSGSGRWYEAVSSALNFPFLKEVS